MIIWLCNPNNLDITIKITYCNLIYLTFLKLRSIIINMNLIQLVSNNICIMFKKKDE